MRTVQLMDDECCKDANFEFQKFEFPFKAMLNGLADTRFTFDARTGTLEMYYFSVRLSRAWDVMLSSI